MEQKPFTRERLATYIPLRKEVDGKLDRLARMKSEESMPPMRPSDGSKRTPGTGDRMERAILRRMAYEERESARIAEIQEEMEAIETAINSLADPQEREVMAYRYMDGSYYRLMKWREIALKVFGDDDDNFLRAVFRIHERALKNLQGGTED